MEERRPWRPRRAHDRRHPSTAAGPRHRCQAEALRIATFGRILPILACGPAIAPQGDGATRPPSHRIPQRLPWARGSMSWRSEEQVQVRLLGPRVERRPRVPAPRPSHLPHPAQRRARGGVRTGHERPPSEAGIHASSSPPSRRDREPGLLDRRRFGRDGGSSLTVSASF